MPLFFLEDTCVLQENVSVKKHHSESGVSVRNVEIIENRERENERVLENISAILSQQILYTYDIYYRMGNL